LGGGPNLWQIVNLDYLVKQKLKTCMEKRPEAYDEIKPLKTWKEYYSLLEEYWRTTEATRPGHFHWKLPHISKALDDFKSKNELPGPKAKIISAFLVLVISSMLMGITLVLCVNEILELNVSLTFKNIALVSALFMIGRIKFSFFENR
jgi:hypothetical protein